IGFTLDELAQILRVRDAGGAPCRQVRHLAAAKLEAVETRLRDLLAMREILRNLLQDWDERLQEVNATERVGLLESLAESRLNPRQPSSLLTTTQRKSKKERISTK